jgi:UDP-glucuronate 4-epimerase
VKTVLITGAAGFIGFHAAKRWLDQGARVIGVDSFSEYYDPQLKRDRAAILAASPNYVDIEGKIETLGLLADAMVTHKPQIVVHLAAQAGVRFSIEEPRTYVESNLQGTFELLEAARATPPEHLVLASTSSVYGANKTMPYVESQKADAQISFYAATKKANEAMAHSYAHLYGLPVTMFRFFTVYGPWGRPDMALFKFVKAISQGQPIDVYNHGDMKRDFTYIDDLVTAVQKLSAAIPQMGEPVLDTDSLSSAAPFRVVNIGKAKPDRLGDLIDEIETALGKTAIKNMMDIQPGDMHETWSDTSLLKALTGYAPSTELPQGIPEFVNWYKQYYGA